MSKSKTKRTLVFDLDGTLETPYFDKEAKSKVKAWMKRHPSGNTFDRMYAEVMEDKLPHCCGGRTTMVSTLCSSATP